MAEASLGAPVAADWFLVSTPNTGVSSTVVTRSVPSATVSATATISVVKTNTTAGTGSVSPISSSPSTMQSSSGAMIMGVKSMLVVVGALGCAVNLL